ncbi:MAG: transcriptional regulator, partial [Planctomycetota bacterium]|nr:transcriptional regulator [Planctomycetota bacterium]
MAEPDKERKPGREESRVTAMDLDAMIHERLRLGILSVLAAGEPMSFAGLRDALGATDGNLGVQARKLE